jgi:glycosyltransferase involved in cell wall biosynthesis
MASAAPVSAYVPCFNAGAALRLAVESVLAQTVAPAEVLVIDDGSDDGSVELLRGLPVRIVRHQQNLGRGAARARAMAEAKYPLLLCCDAGNALAPTFLAGALPWFEDPAVAAVFGKITQAPPRNASDRWRGRHLFKLDVAQEVRHAASLSTFGTVMRASAVATTGGFRADMRHNEDAELGERLLAAGFDVVYDPRIQIVSTASNTVRQLLERYWRWYAGPDGAATWGGYWRNIRYSLGFMARQDLSAGDPLSAAISVICPHYQFWRARHEGRSRGI